MAGLWDGSSRYVRIGTGSSIVYPVGGWSLIFMFRPDVLGVRNSQDYMWGHGTPGSSFHAINVSLIGTGGTGSVGEVRCRIELGSTLYLLQNTTNAATDSVWNAFALVWDTTNFQLTLNGTTTTHAPVNTVASLTPTEGIRLGQRFDLSSSRAYHGRLAHPALYSRALSNAQAQTMTAAFVSPRLHPESMEFHVELWNGSNLFDERGNQTVVPVSMGYAAHAPASYPSDEGDIFVPVPIGPKQSPMSQWTFA